MKPAATIRPIAIIACLLFLAAQSFAQGVPQAPPDDDPRARAEFDRVRFADPATGRIPECIRQRELEFAKTLPVAGSEQFLKAGMAEKAALQQWAFRGPRNIGGRVRAFGIDIMNEQVMLAGGVSGGMWKTIDGGASWARVTALDALQSASCIAQDTRPGHTNVWYYGTGELYGNSARDRSGDAPYRGNGIFKSTDNGSSWSQLASSAMEVPNELGLWSYVMSVATDGSRMDSSIVYAATRGSLFRSNNSGESWQLVLGGSIPGSRSIEVTVSSEGVVYATFGTDGVDADGQNSALRSLDCGIYRSPNGLDWTNITSANWPTNYTRVLPAIAPSNEDIVYFFSETPGAGYHSTYSDDEDHSLFKYNYVAGDGTGTGGIWQNLSSNIPDYANRAQYRSQGSYSMAIAVKPDDANVVVLGGTNLYINYSGFADAFQKNYIGGYKQFAADWSDYHYPNHHPDIHGIVFSSTNPNVMYTASDGGIHRTDDCEASTVIWESLNNGFLTTQFYSVNIHPTKEGDQTVIGGMQDNGTFGSRTPQVDWTWLGGGDGGFCGFAEMENMFYIMSQRGRFYYSITDNDMNNLYYDEHTVQSDDSYQFIAPMEIDPTNVSIGYLASYSHVYRNTELGEGTAGFRWEEVSEADPPAGNISTIEVSTNPANGLYTGSSASWIGYLENALAPTGPAVNITGSNFPENAWVSSIASDPENPGRVMAVFSNYNVPSLFYTTNNGLTWTDVSGNLEEYPDGSGAGPSCRWAEVAHAGSNTIWFVATSTGLYSTTKLDGASTVWQQEGADLIGNAVVPMIRIRPADNYMAIATHGNGVFTTNVVPVPVSGTPDVPASMYLEPCVPNPANAVAQARYRIPATQDVTLKVYDALGREVHTLVEGTAQPGVHTAAFNVAGLTPGMYFVRLHAGSYSQTRTLVVQ